MSLVLDKIFNLDCIEYMKTLPDECVDCIITSPPYSNQRIDTYGGVNECDYPEWLFSVCKEIFRILKPTGSFVLNIKEHVVNGCRSTYVLKTVLLLSELFMWNDTFIWNKENPFPTGCTKRCKDAFEYCYLFVKSKDYKFDSTKCLVPSTSKNLEAEKRRNGKKASSVTNGSGMSMHNRYASDMVRPSNVISLPTDNSNHEHPATFPLQLPKFFIKILTDVGDVVFDPFCGSGTTLVAAKQLKRHYIGTDVVSRYVDISEDRLRKTQVPLLIC